MSNSKVKILSCSVEKYRSGQNVELGSQNVELLGQNSKLFKASWAGLLLWAQLAYEVLTSRLPL